MDLPQVGPRLHAEFTDEESAHRRVDVQRLGLPPGPVQRVHQPRLEPFPQRVPDDQGAELVDDPFVLAERGEHLQVLFGDRQPPLLQVRDRRLQRRAAGHVLQRVPAPEAERQGEVPGRRGDLGTLPGPGAQGHLLLEQGEVQLASLQYELVGAGMGDQAGSPLLPGWQQAAQPGHVGSEVGGGGRR
nr:hypothetical protein [Streptacidiphilus sp. P02-A3a]